MRHCENFFAAEGCIVDQPFQPRLRRWRQRHSSRFPLLQRRSSSTTCRSC
jgi:hypothetical protein